MALTIERVVLPDTVTEIGSFDDCLNLKKINIPASVKRIEGFDNCPNLIVTVDENSYAKQYCEINGIEYELSGKQASGDNIVESLPDVQNEYKSIYFDYVAESLSDYDFAMLLDVLGDSTPELLMMEDNRNLEGGMLNIYAIDSWGDVNSANISHVYKPTSEVYYINNDSESIWLVTDCQQETSMGLSPYAWRTDKCVSITQGTDMVSRELIFSGEVRFHQTDHEEYVVDEKCRARDDGAIYDSNKEDYFKWLSKYFDEAKSVTFDYNKMVHGKDAILAMLQN